jgi:hypothetical protein
MGFFVYKKVYRLERSDVDIDSYKVLSLIGFKNKGLKISLAFSFFIGYNLLIKIP